MKLATIPQKIGVKQTKMIGIFLLIMLFALEFFKDETHVNSLLSLSIVLLTTGVFLIVSKEVQGTYYSSFWVEGLPVLWLLLVLLFS